MEFYFDKLASQINWNKPYTILNDKKSLIANKWFSDGLLNLS